MPMPVKTVIENDYVLNVTEVANPTTTAGKILFPVPARWVEVKFVKSGATTTGYKLFVVPNAYSDAEAAVKLAAAGQRLPVPLGDSVRLDFTADAPCTRIDYVSDAATEAGALAIITWGTDA